MGQQKTASSGRVRQPQHCDSGIGRQSEWWRKRHSGSGNAGERMSAEAVVSSDELMEWVFLSTVHEHEGGRLAALAVMHNDAE